MIITIIIIQLIAITKNIINTYRGTKHWKEMMTKKTIAVRVTVILAVGYLQTDNIQQNPYL